LKTHRSTLNLWGLGIDPKTPSSCQNLSNEKDILLQACNHSILFSFFTHMYFVLPEGKRQFANKAGWSMAFSFEQ
jgi:hypothetical protein